jgi:hypothetical protein
VHRRDKWELDDDKPMMWRATVDSRARKMGQRVSEDARWALFALQTTLEAFTARPGSDFVRDVVLYGPLANGAPVEVVSLAVIVRADAPPAGRSRVWDDLDELFVEAERMYALKFDCVVVNEADIVDPQRMPADWYVISSDHVVVWSTMFNN